MQNNQELNKLQKFFNRCQNTFFIKKPSWLKYYCISRNATVCHFAIIRGYEIFVQVGKFDSFSQLKEYYDNFKENPSQDAIMYEYVKWEKWM